MKKLLQSHNKFNALFKARLVKVDNIYNLELDDGLHIYTYVDQNLLNYLYKNKVDLDKFYTWKGQYTTSQHPKDSNIDVLKVVKLTSLEIDKEPQTYFSFVVHPFQIQDTQIDKFDKKYNFILANFLTNTERESIKLCYTKLVNEPTNSDTEIYVKGLEFTEQGHPLLISTKDNRKPIKVKCFRDKLNIVIKEMELLY